MDENREGCPNSILTTDRPLLEPWGELLEGPGRKLLPSEKGSYGPKESFPGNASLTGSRKTEKEGQGRDSDKKKGYKRGKSATRQNELRCLGQHERVKGTRLAA